MKRVPKIKTAMVALQSLAKAINKHNNKGNSATTENIMTSVEKLEQTAEIHWMLWVSIAVSCMITAGFWYFCCCHRRRASTSSSSSLPEERVITTTAAND